MTERANHHGTHLAVRLISDLPGDGPSEWQFAQSETIRIGRSSENDIPLRHEKLSRLHATLSHNGEHWVFCNVGRNGTFHEGRSVKELPLADGMVLEFVRSGPRLHFQMVDEICHDIDTEDDLTTVKWMQHLAHGDTNAANNLWRDYFHRVVQLARTQIASRHRRIADEEDVAVSVLESLHAGMAAGRFPDLDSRDSLWRLLCVMTKRKVARHVKHEQRQKRGGGRVRGESVFVDAGAADSQQFGIEQVQGADDAMNFGVQLAEETEWLFHKLGDDELCRIAELKLAECTNDEIAEELGCHVRTVKRRLQTIRSIIASAAAEDD